LGHILKRKTESHLRSLFHAPLRHNIALHFGIWDDIADMITHVKFYVNQFGGFWSDESPNLPFSKYNKFNKEPSEALFNQFPTR